jgi:hypothetical protein
MNGEEISYGHGFCPLVVVNAAIFVPRLLVKFVGRRLRRTSP